MVLTDDYRQWVCDYISGGVPGTAFNNTNAHIGVGDSATAAARTQTNLQASSNKVKVAMDTDYPCLGDQSNTMIFQSTFGSAVGNFAWQEWGVFNASSGGIMLNRKVEDNGTKVSGMVWIFQVIITLE